MNKLSLFLLILILQSAISSAQDKKVPSETWLNSQHQPEKLMDAIGLKKGMTIADIGAGSRADDCFLFTESRRYRESLCK